jgi:hypothetical protein
VEIADMPCRLLAALAVLAVSAPTIAETPAIGPKLQARLKGRVAGEPVSCVPVSSRSRTSVVDRNAILISRGQETYYVNFPACSTLREDRALVIDADKRRVCEGDDMMIMNLETGITYGSCEMGPFIPYARVEG